MLPNSGILDQHLVVTIKAPIEEFPILTSRDSVIHEAELANSVQLQANTQHLDCVKITFRTLQFVYAKKEQQ